MADRVATEPRPAYRLSYHCVRCFCIQDTLSYYPSFESALLLHSHRIALCVHLCRSCVRISAAVWLESARTRRREKAGDPCNCCTRARTLPERRRVPPAANGTIDVGMAFEVRRKSRLRALCFSVMGRARSGRSGSPPADRTPAILTIGSSYLHSPLASVQHCRMACSPGPSAQGLENAS